MLLVQPTKSPHPEPWPAQRVPQAMAGPCGLCRARTRWYQALSLDQAASLSCHDGRRKRRPEPGRDPGNIRTNT